MDNYGYLTQAITDTTNVDLKLFNGARTVRFHTHVTSSLAGKFYVTYNGTDFTPVPVTNLKTGAVTAADTTVTPADESIYIIDVGGAQTFRFTPSAGTGTVAVAASNAPMPSVPGTGGTTVSGNKVDDAAFTVGSDNVLAVGMLADETSTDSVDEGDIGIPRMTLDRKQLVTLQAHTAGGASVFQSLDLDETEEDVKTSAGMVYGFTAYNLHASTTYYLKFYNATAANVTVGTTAATMTYTLDADKLTGFMFSTGVVFDTAICVAAEDGLLDNGAPGAPGTNEVVIQVFYK